MSLQYESHPSMSIKTLHHIANEARDKYSIVKCAVYHRIEECVVGEVSVVVAVSSVHRRDSLAAVEYIIDAVKARCEIWKKEVYEDGESAWKANSDCHGCK